MSLSHLAKDDSLLLPLTFEKIIFSLDFEADFLKLRVKCGELWGIMVY